MESRWRLVSCLVIVGVTPLIGVAQVAPGEPGWFVRVIDSASVVDSLAKHNDVLSLGPILQIHESTAEFIDYSDHGAWDHNRPWPVTLVDDFVVRAKADVTIPAGHWGVGWGSDDGGQMKIRGVEFVTSWEGDREWNPGNSIIGTDRLAFDGNRGYRQNFGAFVLEEPLETQIDVSMWDRGGDDSFEVFYIDLQERLGIDAEALTADAMFRPDPANGWDLLGDRNSINPSWNLTIPTSLPSLQHERVREVYPGQIVDASARVIGHHGELQIQPGLRHFWYAKNNPGSYEGVTAFYDFNAGPIEEPDIFPFNPDNTWWTGNQAPLVGGTTEAPKYPLEIIRQNRWDGGTFNGSDNSNYTTVLSGEIRFPRDGEYVFTDGVDDLAVLAIDVNRDGRFGDEEFLINDNAWTDLQREANDGGFPGEYIPVAIDVPDDGSCDDAEHAADVCWYRIEVVFAEGGGTDAGILYWNENPEIEFPTENGDGRVIAAENLSELAIPEDHLRAPGFAFTHVDLYAELRSGWSYEFEVYKNGTFDSLEVGNTLEDATTILDLNDAAIRFIGVGDLSKLNASLKVLVADNIIGELERIILPEGVNVDTSRLATEGIVVFGGCDSNSGADLDGNGVVEFADFIILSSNFGKAVSSHVEGDIDCNGTVGFSDFLVLSGSFGNLVGAKLVPEPAGLPLVGWVCLLFGLRRARPSKV